MLTSLSTSPRGILCVAHNVRRVPPKLTDDVWISQEDRDRVADSVDGLSRFHPLEISKHNVGSNEGLMRVVIAIEAMLSLDRYAVIVVDINIYMRLLKVRSSRMDCFDLKVHVCLRVIVRLRPQWHRPAMERSCLHLAGFVAYLQAGEPQSLPEVRAICLCAVLSSSISWNEVFSKAPLGASGNHVHLHPVVVQTLANSVASHAQGSAFCTYAKSEPSAEPALAV